ncbi:MAG: DUF2304 domain-containing protein [Bacteriovoracaceae bacterium]
MSVKLYFLVCLFVFAVLTTIFYLIKKNKLSEDFSSIWLFVALLLFGSTLFFNQFLAIYSLFKGDSGSGPEILILLCLVFVLFFLILVSVKLSISKKEIVRLSQHIGILELKIREKDTK